jgi:hypothetical protein
MPRLDMNNHTPEGRQPRVQVLRAMDIEEIIPRIKHRIDPHVSLTESHKGRYMQEP